MSIIPSPRPAMKPPASLVSDMPTHSTPESMLSESRRMMQKIIIIIKIRQMRSIPAPARAFQLTITEERSPATRAITEVMQPTEGSDYTHTEN